MSTGLPLTPDLIYDEIKSAREILTRWEDRVQKIPGADTPATEEELAQFVRELSGELLIASGKMQNLSVVLTERLFR